MYTSYRAPTEDAKALRKKAGEYIKRTRVGRDLTQSALARLLGIEYYTFISQVESGAARVPPDQMHRWAQALGVDRREFARTLLTFYDPHMAVELFGDHGKPKVVSAKPRKRKPHGTADQANNNGTEA